MCFDVLCYSVFLLSFDSFHEKLQCSEKPMDFEI